MAFSFDLNVHPFTIVPYCFQDFSVLTNYEIGEAFCSALSIISYKLLETFLRHTLPIRNKPITVFALYDFSIKHQSSKLVTLHCWSPFQVLIVTFFAIISLLPHFICPKKRPPTELVYFVTTKKCLQAVSSQYGPQAFTLSHLLRFTQQEPTGSALEPSPAILYFDDGEKTGRALPVCLSIAGSWAFPDLHFLLHSDNVRQLYF